MTRIGGYQIISRIAQGGMATVYLAQHPDRADLVALKVLSPGINEDPEFLARFEREAHIISTLIHTLVILSSKENWKASSFPRMVPSGR